MICPVHLDAVQVAAIEEAGEAFMRAGDREKATACWSVVQQYRRAEERARIVAGAQVDNVVRLHDYGLRVGA